MNARVMVCGLFALRVSALLVAAPVPAAAQQPPQQDETKLGADFRRERERFGEKCNGFTAKSLMGCATTLITDHPLHLAVGSLAPQNGFGFGGAFVPPQMKPNDSWRINWSADGVATPGGAWRAGAYATFVYTNVGGIDPTGPGGGTDPGDVPLHPYPTIGVFAQSTSLSKIFYYGLGNDSLRDSQTQYEMQQTTIGTRVAWPFGRSGFLGKLAPTAIAELNGRWTDVGGSSKGPAPPIDALFTDASAPGLAAQPATTQFGEGLRIAPVLGRFELAYTGLLQQYVAGSDASFQRWTLDLGHVFRLSRTRGPAAERDHNGPNECMTSVDRTVGVYGCPDPTLVTTNRVGSLGFRALVSESSVSGTNRVPFYFQRTLGGSDIDGERLLASYDDYRFRGPKIFVLQETFEQAIWGPIGVFAMAEQGRVALTDQSLGDGTLHKTYGAGLSLRAGGTPMVTMWWATGSGEGHHVAIRMSASLFGGGSRPSLK